MLEKCITWLLYVIQNEFGIDPGFVQRKRGEMRQRLAWNGGKPYVQSYRPLSILWHTLLATVSRQTLSHLTFLPLYVIWHEFRIHLGYLRDMVWVWNFATQKGPTLDFISRVFVKRAAWSDSHGVTWLAARNSSSVWFANSALTSSTTVSPAK